MAIPASSISPQQMALLQLTDSLSPQEVEKLITDVTKEKFKSLFELFGNYCRLSPGAERRIIPQANQKLNETMLEKLKKRFSVDYPVPPTPLEMGDNVILRGHFEKRFFIIIRLEATDHKTGKVTTVTELIFQRYSCDDMTDNYVTSRQAIDPNDMEKPPLYGESYLYSTGSMSKNQIDAVKDLLQGKTIRAPVAPKNSNISLKLAAPGPVEQESDTEATSSDEDWVKVDNQS